jgi:uncharacterized protein (DUF1778 family)
MADKHGMRIEFTPAEHNRLRVAAALRRKPMKQFVQDAAIAATKKALNKGKK